MSDPSLNDLESGWQSKGGTLSDKTACKEFGLTRRELIQAIQAGKLQYRDGSIYGNPYLRFLRREVEALVRVKHGDHYLEDRQSMTELARINRELRRLQTQITVLEKQKAKLLATL